MDHPNRFYKIIVAFLCFLIVLGIGAFVKYENKVDIHEYTLEEVEDGIYGYYNAVRSSIPAYNYEVVVLCIDGQLYNMAGNVNIHYADDEFKCIHKDTNQVYNDTFDVYIPKGSLEMMADVVMVMR